MITNELPIKSEFDLVLKEKGYSGERYSVRKLLIEIIQDDSMSIEEILEGLQ